MTAWTGGALLPSSSLPLSPPALPPRLQQHMQLASNSSVVMGPSTPKKASSSSPPSQQPPIHVRPGKSKEQMVRTRSCVDVICCDADHSVPVSCATDCRECTSSAPSSPCSDIHHISSACTEPTCGAASSSSSTNLCPSAVPCCETTVCAGAPSSPCSKTTCSTSADCSSMMLAVPTISTCCTDEACESELSPRLKAKANNVCDGVVSSSSDVHAHDIRHAHRPQNECRECRGSLGSTGTAQDGQLYSSFQELLDCCCCSMPPSLDQCCVGTPPQPCNAPHPSPADVTSPAMHSRYQHSSFESTQTSLPPSHTPSSSILSNATQNTSPGRDQADSRASTTSTAATPQPVSASPSSALQWSSTLLHASTLNDKNKDADASPFNSHQSMLSFEDVFPGLQSWNDCTFEQPHLHSSHGGCLPPAMTLCNSDMCSATAPHSHWMSNAHANHPGAMQPTSIVNHQQDARSQVCQWGGCNERFWTVEELVAHVNHSHLARNNVAAEPSSSEKAFFQPTEHPDAKRLVQTQLQSGATHGLECLWKDCHQVPVAEKLDFETFSPTTEADLWKTNNAAQQNDKISLALLQHLLHDHLGQQTTQPTSVKGEHPVSLPTPQLGTSVMSTSKETAPLTSKKRTNSGSSSGAFCSETEQLCCRWEGCSATFDSHSALTEHIETVHVGSGKAEYECRWIGCPRHASGQKFSQKQKVLRHIQTHTGDRPFKCTQCGKRFSEQNTLAQHMRTHTLERPYVCDYPGCGKAFSVAGSLTIHKRTHTGSKPFVCSFPGCGKAFAESSNLTKHVRTHTGDKPFRCEECGKCFSRPDQASRHRKTHERKRAKIGTATETAVLG